MAEHVHAVEEKLLLDDTDIYPKCEITRHCAGDEVEPPHEYDCGTRARWIARWTCSHGHLQQRLVCDACRDELTFDGRASDITWEAL